MKKLTIVALQILNIFLLTTTGQEAQAADSKSYSVLVLDEQGQVDPKGYFDVVLNPGAKKVINLKIRNTSTEGANFSLHINPGVTGDSGRIVYNKRKQKIDQAALFDVRKQVTIPQNKYYIPAHTQKTIPVTVNMPNVVYDGLVLGGLELNRLDDNDGGQTATQSGVVSKISYQIPLQIQQQKQNLVGTVEYLKTTAKNSAGLPVFAIALRNPVAATLQDVTFTTNIFKDQVEILAQKFNDIEIAPTGDFTLKLHPGEDKIDPGNYRVQIKGTLNGQTKWEFDRKFTISGKKAANINQNSVYLQKKSNPWMIVAIVAGVLSLLTAVAVLVLVVRSRRERGNKNEGKS